MPVNPEGPATGVQRPRGRPRSLAARDAILDAAAKLVAKGGIGAVTMEGVARMAGVGKPTIYRYWSGREDLAMAALLHSGAPQTAVAPSGSALDDLARQMQRVAAAFTEPRGRNAALIVASAEADSELSKAFRNRVMLASREEGRALLVQAIAEHRIRSDIDPEVVLDMLYGPIFYRLLVGHAPLDPCFVWALLEEALRGLTLPPHLR